MKIYKVHWINILIIALGLSVIAYTSTRQLIDPTYLVLSRRYIPAPILWCFVLFCWYRFLTTAYKVEIGEQGQIRTISFTGSRNINRVQKITEGIMFIKVVSPNGSAIISTLIDGISHVKVALKSIAHEES